MARIRVNGLKRVLEQRNNNWVICFEKVSHKAHLFWGRILRNRGGEKS